MSEWMDQMLAIGGDCRDVTSREQAKKIALEVGLGDRFKASAKWLDKVSLVFSRWHGADHAVQRQEKGSGQDQPDTSTISPRLHPLPHRYYAPSWRPLRSTLRSSGLWPPQPVSICCHAQLFRIFQPRTLRAQPGVYTCRPDGAQPLRTRICSLPSCSPDRYPILYRSRSLPILSPQSRHFQHDDLTIIWEIGPPITAQPPTSELVSRLFTFAASPGSP